MSWPFLDTDLTSVCSECTVIVTAAARGCTGYCHDLGKNCVAAWNPSTTVHGDPTCTHTMTANAEADCPTISSVPRICSCSADGVEQQSQCADYPCPARFVRVSRWGETRFSQAACCQPMPETQPPPPPPPGGGGGGVDFPCNANQIGMISECTTNCGACEATMEHYVVAVGLCVDEGSTSPRMIQDRCGFTDDAMWAWGADLHVVPSGGGAPSGGGGGSIVACTEVNTMGENILGTHRMFARWCDMAVLCVGDRPRPDH